MSSPEKRPPLVVILGPTAVGKTEIALELAEHFSGEIVSADSRLFYCGMDIGTAKPSVSDRSRVPHHLIDIAQPDQIVSLAHFQEMAHQSILAILQRRHLPFLVGGTGQYVRAVLEGWQTPPVEPQPGLRAFLENWAQEIGQQGLHDRLAVLDPQSAERIDARNLRRTVRALEVILTTGQRFSDQRLHGDFPYNLLMLGLARPRADLYNRIDDRIEKMFDTGLIEEVQKLLEQGYSAQLPPMSAIGYRETLAYIKGEINLEEAKILIRRATRTYVRRQANWFKSEDPTIRWFDYDDHTVSAMKEAILQWNTNTQNGKGELGK